MSAEKHQQLIDSGQLNPDGSRKNKGAAVEVAEGDAVAEAEAIAAQAADPNQEG